MRPYNPEQDEDLISRLARYMTGKHEPVVMGMPGMVSGGDYLRAILKDVAGSSGWAGGHTRPYFSGTAPKWGEKAISSIPKGAIPKDSQFAYTRPSDFAGKPIPSEVLRGTVHPENMKKIYPYSDNVADIRSEQLNLVKRMTDYFKGQ